MVDVQGLVSAARAFLDRGEDAGSGAVVAGVGQRGQPGRRGGVEGGQGVVAGGGEVVGGAGLDVGDPQRAAVGGGEELDVATEALVLAGVPQVVAFGSGPGEPVGADQGASRTRWLMPSCRQPRRTSGSSGACSASTSMPSCRYR